MNLEIFQKIDILNNKNNQKLFLFFFAIAICGYASFLTSGILYSDDYIRYILNYSTCCSNGRYGNTVLEYLMFLSHIVLDAAPFTQIFSCAVLAFIALICIRMFCKTVDCFSVLFAASITVNPYLLETIIFRFDNHFMTLGLLAALLAAYISSQNDSRNFILPAVLLFCSLSLYQAALSAYFIVFFYLLIDKVSQRENISSLVKFMKNWGYALASAAVLYLPVALNIHYTKISEKTFIGNNFEEYFNFVLKKVYYYFENIYQDWHSTYVGVLFSIFILGFIAYFFTMAWKNKSSYRDYAFRSVLLAILIFAFFLSPIGITIFFNHAGARPDTTPLRIIYSIVIAFFLILHRAHLFFEKKFLLEPISKFFAFVFLLWNITLTNATGNLMKQKCELQNGICSNIAEDIYSFPRKQDIKRVLIACDYIPIFLKKALQEYPVLNKIFAHQWNRPFFSNILLKYNGEFFPFLEKHLVRVPDDAVEIVDRQWYKLYFSEKDLLIIKVKDSH
ncbi:MAG: glucosyltransferase domain-containing protein [Holosporaceae bacterium]|jgi:uncharacterized protein with PQ loop repeat|nr:glucosyltransferase domain-containing protein [Holosporaceae bacterium]